MARNNKQDIDFEAIEESFRSRGTTLSKEAAKLAQESISFKNLKETTKVGIQLLTSARERQDFSLADDARIILESMYECASGNFEYEPQTDNVLLKVVAQNAMRVIKSAFETQAANNEQNRLNRNKGKKVTTDNDRQQSSTYNINIKENTEYKKEEEIQTSTSTPNSEVGDGGDGDNFSFLVSKVFDLLGNYRSHDFEAAKTSEQMKDFFSDGNVCKWYALGIYFITNKSPQSAKRLAKYLDEAISVNSVSRDIILNELASNLSKVGYKTSPDRLIFSDQTENDNATGRIINYLKGIANGNN